MRGYFAGGDVSKDSGDESGGFGTKLTSHLALLDTAIAPYTRVDAKEEFGRLSMTFATLVSIGDIAIGNLQNVIEGVWTLVDSLAFELMDLIPNPTEYVVGNICVSSKKELL